LDANHLLFTFRTAGLLKRVPDDPADDEDQNIHAVVFDLATGKAEHETDWRMHDHARYIWPLSDGRFLVRMRNSLFITDDSLVLKPYLEFETKLRAVEISPDDKQLLLEVEQPAPPQAQADGAAAPPSLSDTPMPRTSAKLKIFILKAGTRDLFATSEARHPVSIPMLMDGFIDVIASKKTGMWTVRQVPYKGETRTIAEIKSTCQPILNMLSASVVLISSCSKASGDDQQVSAYSLEGTQLWQQVWQSRYIWPTFDFAENGSRFAFASIEVNRPIGAFEPLASDAVLGQMVGIFNTQTGKLDFVKTANPVISAGQNYALSKDGRRFAILRDGAIEVYDLPPVGTVSDTAKK
jgi:hypothetical protein